MKRVQSHYSDRLALDQVKHYSKNCYFKGNGPLNQTYRNLFSLVDVADGYWYAVAETHKINHWSGKFILSIMKFFINNLWCLFCNENAVNLGVFREKMADLMANWE